MYKLNLINRYTFECYRGNILVWREDIKNLIVTVGLNDILDKYLKGSAYSASWFVGLIDDAGFSALAIADTLASHAGWTEFTNYTGVRKTLTLGAISGGAVDNAASKAEYTIGVGGGTINGGFICTVNSGTSGILYGEGSFTTPRAVSQDDVLKVTVELSALNG